MVSLMLALLSLCSLLLGLSATPLLAQTTFPGLSQTGPAASDFCPYAVTSPWRRPLPEHPTHTLPAEQAEAQRYVTNAGPTGIWWRASGDRYFSRCYAPDGGQPWYRCGGNAGVSAYVASATDPLVTYRCTSSETSYGCYDVGGTPVTAMTVQIRVPHNLVPTCNWTDYCGDSTWGVVQPDGTTYEIYGCEIHEEFTGGEILGTGSGSSCQRNGVPRTSIGGGLRDNLATGEGRNATITSGPNIWALPAYYNQVGVATPQPHLALWLITSCNGPGFRYPATSGTNICSNNPGDGNSNGRGLPTGTHLQLTMTHADIDLAIANGQVPAPFRGILYAAHDYGLYLGDTHSDTTPKLTDGLLEDTTQAVANGAPSAWTPWFEALVPYGAVMDAGTGESGANSYYINYNPFYAVASSFQVVDECYAHGTCSDSIAVTGCPGVTSPAPALVAQYQFNETARDSTPFQNHLTLQPSTGVPIYVSTGSVYGSGLQLNGTTQYAVAPQSSSLALTTGMTLAGWVRPSATLTAPSKPLVMRSFVYWLFTNNGESPCGAGFVGPWAGIMGSDGDWHNVCTTTPLPVGQWTHLAATLNGSTLTLYRNGTAVGTPLTVPIPILTTSNSNEVLNVGGDPNAGEKIPGILDEVRVYNYALTASEIAALATPPPDTIGGRWARHRSTVR